MATMFVDVPALNFRSEAHVHTDTRIGTVFLGQKIKKVKYFCTDDWVSCRARIDGQETEGFVLAKHLRSPLSRNREKLVASVHREWMRFVRGAGKEYLAPYHKYIGEMWNAIGINLDGTDTDSPWSAAAVSFMVKNAGNAYENFKFAASHSKFVHHAINARFEGDRSVPFWGYRLDEVQPEIGDIICRDNPKYAPAVDFDIAKNLSSYRSHTDVIMRIDSTNNKILSIGGNVSDSVKIAQYDLSPGDFAADTNHTFAILKNITDKEEE